MTTKAQQAEAAEALEQIRAQLKPGDTVYTILRQRSQSGMSRHISLVTIQDGAAHEISWRVGRALGYRRNQDDGGLVVSGAGMDMGFSLVYELGRMLWPDGYICSGLSCQSNDHINGDRDYSPHPHHDGGYALRHEWL